MHSLYGCGGILKTRNLFPNGLTPAEQDFKYGETDFQIVDDILISMWKDQGSKAAAL
jgi:hypothetical protein